MGCRDLNFQTHLQALGVDVTAVEAQALFALFDTDEHGMISIDEFFSSISRLNGPATAVDSSAIKLSLMSMNTKLKQMRDVMLMEKGFIRDSGSESEGSIMPRNQEDSNFACV